MIFIILLLVLAFLLIPRRVRYETPSGKYYRLYARALEEHHLLIAGITGSGKSVFMDGMLHALMYRLPLDVEGGAQMVLIDPKGTELQRYKNLPHVLRYADMNSGMIAALEYGYNVMQSRFEYNKKHNLRYYPGSDLYIFVDELAFLVWNNKKRVEGLIQSITALGRAAGVHLVVATQSPRNDIIPKMLIANIPAIIGLRTGSKRESSIILGSTDFIGLHTLPDPRTEHKADCYFKTASTHDGKPLEGLYNVPMVDDAEIERLINHWTTQKRGRK